MQSVWVSRVFLHAIITESLGRRTAAQVLDDIADPESLLIDPSSGTPPEGTAFIGDRDVERYVDQMVAAAMSLDDGALSAHPAGDEKAPRASPDRRLGGAALIRLVLRRQAGRHAPLDVALGHLTHRPCD